MGECIMEKINQWDYVELSFPVEAKDSHFSETEFYAVFSCEKAKKKVRLHYHVWVDSLQYY